MTLTSKAAKLTSVSHESGSGIITAWRYVIECLQELLETHAMIYISHMGNSIAESGEHFPELTAFCELAHENTDSVFNLISPHGPLSSLSHSYQFSGGHFPV